MKNQLIICCCILVTLLCLNIAKGCSARASDGRGATAQELDTGDVTVKTVWRNGTDAVVLIIDKETETRCYAAYGSMNCVPAK